MSFILSAISKKQTSDSKEMNIDDVKKKMDKTFDEAESNSDTETSESFSSRSMEEDPVQSGTPFIPNNPVSSPKPSTPTICKLVLL